MARGWESKAIESQQDDVARATDQAKLRPLSDAERRAQARRRTLELSRARTIADLDRSSRPAHRAMLQQALDALDDQLRAIGS